LRRISSERSVLGAFGATALSLSLLVAWARELRAPWLVAALAVLLGAAALLLLARRRTRRPVPGGIAAALLVLLAGMGLAASYSWQFHRMERDWAGVVAQRQAQLGGALDTRMAAVVDRGRAAAGTAAALAARPGADLFRQLAALREQAGVDALAIYTDAGELVAWAGEHRGPLPDSVWLMPGAAWFEERPLFSYLYFSAPLPGRGQHAVAGVLVETGIIGEGRDGATADIVAARTRTRASFRRGGGPDVVWALVEAGDTVVHARLEPQTQLEARRVLERTSRRVAVLTVAGAYAALALAWLRWVAPARAGFAVALPLLFLALLGGTAPLRDAIGAERFFSPLLFTLPVPGDISLGRLLAILLPLGALAAGARRGARRRVRPARSHPLPARPAARSPGLPLSRGLATRSPGSLLARGFDARSPGSLLARGFDARSPGSLLLAAGLGTIVVAAAYPVVIRLLLDSATPALLQDSSALWLGLQFTATLALAVVAYVVLPCTVDDDAGPARLRPALRRVLLIAALLLAAFLSAILVAGPAGAAAWHVPGEPLRPAVAALWALPFLLAAFALAPLGQRSGVLLRWLCVGWLAGTAVLPHLWHEQLDARLATAESELETLGTQADPYLDYLLVSFGREAATRFAAGEEGMQLVYRTWVASGLAREPYPARIVLWSPDGVPVVQLGPAPLLLEAEVERLTGLVEDARQHRLPLMSQFTDLPNVNKLLTVPLADGSLITVVVPPRRSLDRTSAVAPFLGVVAESPVRLNLVEATAPGPEQEPVGWEAGPDGWRSEVAVQYPDGRYIAHLVVPVSGFGMRLVRGMLLLAFNLSLLTVLWLLGLLARGRPAVQRGDWRGWVGSFRARVTVALFGFFLVPTAVFGWAAYNALAGEVARSAVRVAQHSVNQAVIEFDDAGGDLRRLAMHAGTDVLRYHGGELIDVSSREALDLGVYSAWMPPHIHQRLESGEEREAVESQTLGTHSFVTAYRALPPTGTLGVPMSLTAGDTAVRLRELAHLVLFAAVMGALLSLALSVAVGRALAGPIGRLRRAATAVGSGSLRTRLPEHTSDEFGQLYTSFNRMTRRLRRARARELRTARVLAWGEMARQVAHEIKNPLTPIKLSVQHLRRAHADRHPNFDEILDSNVSQILAEIDRLSEIARAFSRYGAPGIAAGPLADIDVPVVVREALMLYRSGDQRVIYVDSVQPGLPRVRARGDELKEVLLNLVENARAALDGTGRIEVRAAERGDLVEIDVADDGPGIPPEQLPRIFEPHFSTRSTGTGLGLAIVRRLVESWGGTVTAESTAGQGTVVRLRLQRAEPPAPDASEARE
jgi:signal transduction histidine kinase